ncbi:MAG: succinate dehydrogenase assembly factor 2 [Succinatimonas hippei]|nr:succinate dehydrogenase assembly factor 2 [Succinatimonas hippei]
MQIPGSVKWHSRRGMREIDLMLLPFVDEDLPKMDEQILKEYQDLLEATDLQLVRWLDGSDQADSESRRHIIGIIRDCHAKRMGGSK